MENLLGGLKVLQGEIKTKASDESLSLGLSGNLTIERGNFKTEVRYNVYGLYQTRHEGIVELDDWESENNCNTTLGDLPIDDLALLKTQLIQSGLTTLSNQLGFTDEEERTEVFKAIENNKDFKTLFGKNARLWRLLSKDEQKLYELKFVCNNFDTCGDHMKKQVAAHYEIDNDVDGDGNEIKIIPTLEVFQSKFAEPNTK
jgi:hypothetical protein